MITDCVEIFKKSLAESSDALILNNYLPKDGTYMLYKIVDDKIDLVEQVDIKYIKKTDELRGKENKYYELVCYLDYHSKLLEMNKPIDPKKIIHTNNYLSFAVKKESLNLKKVTHEILEGYYNVLRNPIAKYEKKAKAKEIYANVESDFGVPDEALINKIETWIKANIFSIDVDTTKKDYLKLFFILEDENYTRELYEKEGNRYLIPNLYNSNDFNMKIGDIIYGLPNDNMGMNAKKPYLGNKTRKVQVPYLLEREEALIHYKFFDYLMGQASIGKMNVYIDTNKETIEFYKPTELPRRRVSGFFLRIQKGKEVEIHNWDQITNFNPNLAKPFYLKQVIKINPETLKQFELGYGPKTNLMELNRLIDNVFFSKSLFHNYFTAAGDLTITDGTIKSNLIMAREKLFGWFYKGEIQGVDKLLEKVSISLIKNSIRNGYEQKVKHQLNLRWSLMDYFSGTERMERKMEDVRTRLNVHINSKDEWEFTNDDEYYYAVGQLVSYYLTKVRTHKKNQSFINPFLNATSNDVIKRRLKQLYKRVNHDLSFMDFRGNNMAAHVFKYQPESVVNQELIIAGFTDSRLIYQPKEEA